MIFYGRKISYGEMFNKVDYLQKVFASHGVKKGDIVSFLVLSSPETIYSLLALNKIGAMANFVNPTFSQEQIRDRIIDAKAEIVIVMDQLFDRLVPVIDEIDSKRIVVLKLDNSMPTIIKMLAHKKLKKEIVYNNRIVSWNNFTDIDVTKIDCSDSSYEVGTPAVMVYSSGSTGAAKGIVLTNDGINHTISEFDRIGHKYTRGSTYLSMGAPWISTILVLCQLMPLKRGIAVVIEPVYTEETFIKGMRRYKPNLTLDTPSHWIAFKNLFKSKKIDLSNLKIPLAGGEKLTIKEQEEINVFFREHNSEARIFLGYGMCELGSGAASNGYFCEKPGSVGCPIVNVVVAAFNEETNQECKYFERGEIRVFTPARMKEYFNRPKATSEFFWKDAQGREWGCTGDVGYVDEDGFVFVEGRASDYFVTPSGRKAYNFDIENVILEVEGVEQCEIVNRKNSDDNSEPVAFVILRENTDADGITASIKKSCIHNLDAELVPTDIRVIDKYPVKPSGKRDMEELARMAEV